jgi:hypothetical protein
VQAVSVSVFTQRALHAAALPCSVWISQPMRGQLVGQVPGGSQVSFSSSLPLPQTGLSPSPASPPSPGWSTGASRTSASTKPDDTPASTMLPTWLGVRSVVQPEVRQQTPIATVVCTIRSQVKPPGHFGAPGSQRTRALGMFGSRVQAAPRASAGSTTANRRIRGRRT